MHRIRIAVSGAALVILLALVFSHELTRPASLEGLDMELEGNVPATFYLPVDLLRTMPESKRSGFG